MARSVCLVSPGNLASNPRLVKEAAALEQAGYDVTTVVCRQAGSLASYDEDLARRATWKVVVADRVPTERFWGAASRPLARAMDGLRLPVPVSVAAAAYGGLVRTLRDAVARVPADLYIAHYVAALPAAATAAARHGGRLGFDAEDFHSGEGSDGDEDRFRMRMVERVERSVLPRCVHLTAAAPLIADAYTDKYGVAADTLLNVFPRDMAPVAPHPASTGALRAYWFSQTIGPDRGLQAFLRAMAHCRADVVLDVRGDNRWGHGDRLMELARELGVAARVNILPMAAPEDMVRLAASYDLGLSLETDATLNRRICLTNKIFTYLLAGVPVLLSDTPAQRALSPDLGRAARLISLDDPQGTAGVLDALADRTALEAAKAEAWQLGQQRYNWDVEKDVLLRSVDRAFEKGGRA